MLSSDGGMSVGCFQKLTRPACKELQEVKMKVAIWISETRNGFRASCPVLPGCVEYGRTRREAMERIAQAVNGYFASMNSQQPVMLVSSEKQEAYA